MAGEKTNLERISETDYQNIENVNQSLFDFDKALVDARSALKEKFKSYRLESKEARNFFFEKLKIGLYAPALKDFLKSATGGSLEGIDLTKFKNPSDSVLNMILGQYRGINVEQLKHTVTTSREMSKVMATLQQQLKPSLEQKLPGLYSEGTYDFLKNLSEEERKTLLVQEGLYNKLENAGQGVLTSEHNIGELGQILADAVNRDKKSSDYLRNSSVIGQYVK